MTLTKKDLEKIEKVLDKHSRLLAELSDRLTVNTSSVMKIEKKIDAALELRQDVKEVREQVKNREERISTLEKFP